jgi:hypothetical protein
MKFHEESKIEMGTVAKEFKPNAKQRINADSGLWKITATTSVREKIHEGKQNNEQIRDTTRRTIKNEKSWLVNERDSQGNTASLATRKMLALTILFNTKQTKVLHKPSILQHAETKEISSRMKMQEQTGSGKFRNLTKKSRRPTNSA